MAGLTPTGFEKKTLSEIKTELEESFKTAFGIFINLLPGTVFALIIGIFAERESLIWEMAEDVYNSQYPATADGVNLDNVVSINNVTRLAATKSKQPGQYLFGTLGALIPEGTQFSVDGNPNAKFVTDNDVTLVAGVNCIKKIEFSGTPASGTWKIILGELETSLLAHNAANNVIEAALLAIGLDVDVTGTYAGDLFLEFQNESGTQPIGVVTVDDTLADGMSAPIDVTVTETQEGEVQGEVDCTATVTGPLDAPAGTLTVIDTPVAGLDRVINSIDAIQGRNRETDAELRLRRQNTLTIAGSATADAIRSKVLNLTGVISCSVFENDESIVVDGRPPHSFEVLVSGGDDQEIADTIWSAKPAGIKTFGDEDMIVVDSQGEERTVYFSRPTPVPIYFSIDLEVDPELFPVNGAAIAKAAIIAWGNAIGFGKAVIIYPQLVSQLNDIPGILDMTIRIDDAPVSVTPGDPAVDDNIPIDPTEESTFSDADGDINILP